MPMTVYYILVFYTWPFNTEPTNCEEDGWMRKFLSALLLIMMLAAMQTATAEPQPEAREKVVVACWGNQMLDS